MSEFGDSEPEDAIDESDNTEMPAEEVVEGEVPETPPSDESA